MLPLSAAKVWNHLFNSVWESDLLSETLELPAYFLSLFKSWLHPASAHLYYAAGQNKDKAAEGGGGGGDCLCCRSHQGQPGSRQNGKLESLEIVLQSFQTEMAAHSWAGGTTLLITSRSSANFSNHKVSSFAELKASREQRSDEQQLVWTSCAETTGFYHGINKENKESTKLSFLCIFCDCVSFYKKWNQLVVTTANMRKSLQLKCPWSCFSYNNIGLSSSL